MSEKSTCEELEQRNRELKKAGSECKQAQEVLRGSEAKFRFLIESMSDIVWTVDLEFNTTYVSPSIKTVLGFTPEERRKQSPEEMITQESLKSIKKLFRKEYIKEKLRSKDPVRSITVMTEYYMKSGSTLWLENHVRWIRNEKGKVTGIHGVSRDITARRKAEEALKESEERYRTFINSTSDLVFLKDSQFKYLVLNKAMTDFYGKSFEEIIGLSDYDLLPEEAADICRASDRDIVATGKIIATEEHFGEKFYEAIKFPVVMQSNEMGVGCFMRDITELKRAQENSQKLMEQLHQSQKLESVGRLAGGVAHDFNNMLCVILGHLEMIQEELPSESSIHSSLNEIQKATRHSTDIVSQLLAFARKQTISPRVLDLNESVGSMLKMLERLIGEDIDLVWLPASNLWSVRLDSTQIDQILTNLCINARDAIDGVGNLTIRTGNITFDEDYCEDNLDFIPGEYVMMSVNDDGCGMDKNTEKNIFEPFFTTKEVGKGTGLGLSTVYGIVRQNNGFVTVYSEPEQGTCIKVYLPRHFNTITSEPQKDSRKPDIHGSETILVVEDEPAILKMIATMLEHLGYTVLPTDHPGEALRLAGEHAGNIHLLITDMVMPVMNGRDLARNLLSVYPEIKCLFMSGYSTDVITHHGVLDKDMQFIQKPFSCKDLAARSRELLDQN